MQTNHFCSFSSWWSSSRVKNIQKAFHAKLPDLPDLTFINEGPPHVDVLEVCKITLLKKEESTQCTLLGFTGSWTLACECSA